MIAVSLADLLLPAIGAGAWIALFVATPLGCLLVWLLSRLLPSEEELLLPLLEPARNKSAPSRPRGSLASRLRYARLAALVALSLTAHNFPEGVAVAASAHLSPHMGLLLCIAIALHNIPEGIAVAMPTLAATQSRVLAVLAALLSVRGRARATRGRG
jgi:ZIP family zinc transporter